MTTSGFAPFAEKMADESLPDAVVRTFEHHFNAISHGVTGLVTESEIRPVTSIESHEDLGSYETAGLSALDRAVVIKLNGGLGTSMGMTQAKSLLRVRGDYTFLDIIARQVLALRERYQCRMPLLLMSSYHTQADCRKRLQAYESLPVDTLPIDFLQNKVPRILAENLCPAEWPEDPLLEWCPPGHGDVFAALKTSGILPSLLEKGFRYAFISNGDNLGATLDAAILGWMSSCGLPFVLEVAERTQSDRKGGHLAQSREGNLTLRESAQCPADEVEQFRDIHRYRYFNTNNLWIDLEALADKLIEHDDVLPLPLMVNKKHIVATDSSTPAVLQTETAMGAAISIFPQARALLVSRDRFAPVKTTNDLLKLWSDLYELTDEFHVRRSPGVAQDVMVDLDPSFYQHVDAFSRRFPHGAPSLAQAFGLTVSGDVVFGQDVKVKGWVNLSSESSSPLCVKDGTVLDSDKGVAGQGVQ